MDEVWAHHVLEATCGRLKHSSNNKLLPTSSLSRFLFTVSVCVHTLISSPSTPPPPTHTHSPTHVSASRHFSALSPSSHVCLRLVFFPCQRLSKQSRVCVCVSGLVTRRSWETGSSRRSTAASSFAGRVRHSPDISLRLRCLFLYSGFDPVPFPKGLPRERGEEGGTKWDAWFSGYEQESGVGHKAKEKGSSAEEGQVLKPQIAKSEK